jgi:choline dehydrogenase
MPPIVLSVLTSLVNSQTPPAPGTLNNNQTYFNEQLALYWAKRQGPLTVARQAGNTVAWLSLPQITSNYQSIIDGAKSKKVSALYPEITDKSVVAGYEAQRAAILRLYSSKQATVQETAWNGDTTYCIVLAKPLSRGSVRINSTDILNSPVIDYGTITDPSDLETLIASLHINRAQLATPPMQELNPVELAPGANVTSDADLRKALRNIIGPSFQHPCCTAAMIPKELGGVVGPDLRVHGVKRLRVVDASIMPLIPAAHTTSTVYAVAEKVCFCSSRKNNLRILMYFVY